MTVIYGMKGADGRALSRTLLRLAVERQWGWTQLPELARSKRGKPEFSGWTDRWMSLTHSDGYVLCALSDDGPVGVDIEVVRPHRAGLPRYVMSDEEFALFDGSWEDFCRIWTMKEAFSKKEDQPLFPPRLVETPPECPHESYSGEGWRGAVCCCGAPPKEIIWLPERE